MEVGSVVKIAFLQADKKIKFRPAIILKEMKPYDDYLVCAISKSIELEVKGFDIVIDENHSDFSKCGLKYKGLIRLGFLQTVPNNYINGVVGNISPDTLKMLLQNLSSYLLK